MSSASEPRQATRTGPARDTAFTATPATSRLPARLAVVAAAAVAAGVVWLIADPLAGIELAVRSGSTTRTVGAVGMVVTALVAGLAGTGLLTLIERFTQRAGRIWTIIAALVLLVSLAGPLGAVTAAVGWTLAATHLLVGGILLVGLRSTTTSAPIVSQSAGRR